ncbi:MAG: hypothetical protein ACK4K0_07000 [Flavobacteriales bacterium]
MKSWLNIKTLVILFFGIGFLILNLRLTKLQYNKKGIDKVIWGDSRGYYEYLPHLFISQNITQQVYALPLPNGNTLNKYSSGVATLQAPFFVSLYGYLKITGQNPTGYEASFGWMIAVCTSIYAFIGFCFLFFYLKNRFNVLAAIITCSALYLGTNMLYYIKGEPGMAHVYSFFCFSIMLYYLDKFYTEGLRKQHFIIVVTFFSLAVLIRQTNIFSVLLIAFYDVYSFNSLKERTFFWWKNSKLIVLSLPILLIIHIPQIAYWYSTTGDFFVNGYIVSGEKFSNLVNPKLYDVLLSVRSGWLPYSWVMVLFFIGIIVGIVKKQAQSVAVLVMFLLIWYICASWWTWNFACSYGYRAFIDYYAFFSIPLALIVFEVVRLKYVLIKIPFILFLALSTYISISLTLDYTCDWCEENWKTKDYKKLVKSYFTNENEK